MTTIGKSQKTILWKLKAAIISSNNSTLWKWVLNLAKRIKIFWRVWLLSPVTTISKGWGTKFLKMSRIREGTWNLGVSLQNRYHKRRRRGVHQKIRRWISRIKRTRVEGLSFCWIIWWRRRGKNLRWWFQMKGQLWVAKK